MPEETNALMYETRL